MSAAAEGEVTKSEGEEVAAAAVVEEEEEVVDEVTTKRVKLIPLLNTRAGPRDAPAEWSKRLKEEYLALIQYVKQNKENDSDWFTIKSNKEGTKWDGKCWYYHENVKYEFAICFDMPVTYPTTAPEIRIPELDGKTTKMYHGGKICLTIHFHPLWNRNVPRFGVAHALALGLGPWLAAEVPDLIARGVIFAS